MLAINCLIVIPAWNEEASLGQVLSDIRRHLNWPIVVVNDGSSDNTAAVALKYGCVVLNHVESKGAWLAMQTGMMFARKNGFDHVVTMDADGQHLASEIEKLASLSSSSDVVVGASVSRGGGLRQAVRRMFRKIGQIEIQDLTSGFRFYNREAIKLLSSYQASFLEYQDVGVLLFLKAAGLRFAEVDVQMQERTNGHSRIYSSWIKIAYYMATTLLLSFAKSVPERSKSLHKRIKY